MSELFTYGSVRGAAGDGGPYRDILRCQNKVDGALVLGRRL